MAGSNDLYPFDTPPPGVPVEDYTVRQAAEIGRAGDFDAGLSITRLVVGGVLWGMDAFMDSLLSWDVLRRQTSGLEVRQDPLQPASPGWQSGERDEPILPQLRYQYSENFIRRRNAVVGLVFAARQSLLRGLQQLDQLQRNISGRVAAVTPADDNRLLQPLRRQFGALVQRGEQEVSMLVRLGQRESEISRTLVETALHESVEESIEYLAEHPEVKELVQLQSTGLADEAVEEIRERSVSADNFVEGLVRYLLRRMPRQEIPPPPPEVREHAERYRPERHQQQKKKE